MPNMRDRFLKFPGHSLALVSLALLLAQSFCFADEPATRPAVETPPAKIAVPLPTTRPALGIPHSVKDLRAIEREVQEVVKKATPATVGVMLGAAQGSGVIVSKDGYVLTAGHVAATPGQNVILILASGRRVRAKTLGINYGIDSGMIKITEPGDWPFVPTGKSADVKPGQWVLALGHPGGYHSDRPPVLRLGRVLTINGNVIDSDCTLVGGDSGGPLLDLDGNLIGIHSRIGASTLANLDVPIDTFTETWDRLAKGEAWGQPTGIMAARGPMLGVAGESNEKGCAVTAISPDSPAEKAGLKVGDVITTLDGRPVKGLEGLALMLLGHKPGDEVTLHVLRGEETKDIKATLAKRQPG
jgi:serine protease Do